MFKKIISLIAITFFLFSFAHAENTDTLNNPIVKIGVDARDNINVQFSKPYSGDYSYYELNNGTTIVILLPSTKSQQKFTSNTTHFAIKNISVEPHLNQSKIIINLKQATPYDVQINNDTIIIFFPKIKTVTVPKQKIENKEPEEEQNKFNDIYSTINNISCQQNNACAQLKIELNNYVSTIEIYNDNYKKESSIGQSKECLSKIILLPSKCLEFNTIETAITKLKSTKEQAYIVSNIYPTLPPTEQDKIIDDYFKNLSLFFKSLKTTNESLTKMEAQEKSIDSLLAQANIQINIPFIQKADNQQSIIKMSQHLNALYQKNINDHKLIMKISKHPEALTQKKYK